MIDRYAIYKFFLPLEDYPIVKMHNNATFLKFDFQDGRLAVWMLVDTKAEKVPHKFRIAGTGHPIQPDELDKYKGTCFHREFVWHLFDLGEDRSTKWAGPEYDPKEYE